MTKDTTEIEVEVVEVDGHPVTQAHANDAPQAQTDWQDWRQWQGKVRRLDSRWWPLWVVLGIIALALIATVGVVVAVVVFIIRAIIGLMRALFR